MTGQARNPTAENEARWAEARSILDRSPTEPAEQHLRRSRRVQLWLVLGGVLTVTAAVMVLFLLVVDRALLRTERDPATPQMVAGFVISGLGLVLMFVVLVVHVRANRRTRAFRSPLYVLSHRQRKELLAQVRGRAPVRPQHVPLARHVAEQVVMQRMAVGSQAGLLVSQVGLWIAQPSTFRTWLVSILGLFLAVFAVVLHRQSRRARRFLAEHPAADA